MPLVSQGSMSHHTNYQFPPSSPLHESSVAAAAHDDTESVKSKDPFAFGAFTTSSSKVEPLGQFGQSGQFGQFNQQRLAREEYPTPNPSSSLFRSSSPVKAHDPLIENQKSVQIILPNAGKRTEKQANTIYDYPSKVDIVNNSTTNKQRKVTINKDFNLLKSEKSVLRIPFKSDISKFSIGRSSRKCEFSIDEKDTHISRAHLNIEYTAHSVTIECLGLNGVGLVIPKPCYIHNAEESNWYKIEVNTKQKPLDVSKIQSPWVESDENHTEFHVHKGEVVTMPRLENIMLEISKQVILLNPVDIDECLTEEDEELTDDEELVLIHKSNLINKQNVPGTSNTMTDKTTPLSKTMLSSSLPNTPCKPKASTIEINVEGNEGESINDSYETPSKEHIVKIKQPKPLSTTTIASSSSSSSSSTKKEPLADGLSTKTSSAQFSIFYDQSHERPRPSSAAGRNSLTNITNRRAVSEEPPSKVLKQNLIDGKSNAFSSSHNNYNNNRTQPSKHSQDEKPNFEKRKKSKTQTPPLFDDSVLQLENISEINNILINHLAFSRLSSTPASFLNTISAVTSKLSLMQVRSVLNNIKCVGVIYRKGKDAAGKPLEEEYYYMPENDDDQSRTQLVANLKGHGGLRSCRRTHKQYYWKKPAPIKKT